MLTEQEYYEKLAEEYEERQKEMDEFELLNEMYEKELEEHGVYDDNVGYFESRFQKEWKQMLLKIIILASIAIIAIIPIAAINASSRYRDWDLEDKEQMDYIEEYNKRKSRTN